MINENWTISDEWNSIKDVKEYLKSDRVNSSYKFSDNCGDYFCYVNKETGEPLFQHYIFKNFGDKGWGVDVLRFVDDVKYNEKAANWMKKILMDYGSMPDKPGKYKYDWDWILVGERKNASKKNAQNIKRQLKPGVVVQMKISDYKVEYVRPNDAATFIGIGVDDPLRKEYRWRYREINDIVEDSKSVTESLKILRRGGYRVVVNEAVDNPDEPATSRQLWALFCITKKDWRKEGLTKGEASAMIQKYNEEGKGGRDVTPAKGQSLESQIVKDIKTNLKPKLDKVMADAVDHESAIEDDYGDKKYKFYGNGCGYAYVKYDKRKKKLGRVIDEYIRIYREKFFKKFADEYKWKYHIEELGGVLNQDVEIQRLVKESALEFAKSIGLDTSDAIVISRLD